MPATADDPPLFSLFDGITATRNRDRGVWLRPDWFVVKNARLATNRDSVSLVSAGGFDGAAPGSWAMLENSIVVGLSQNNVDRFGPCPYPDQALGLPNTGRITGCIDITPITFNNGKPVLPNPGYDVVARGDPTPNWNFAGFMIYDGPALIFNDTFVNFNVDPRKYMTGEDRAALEYFTNNNEFTNHIRAYEGDAALGSVPVQPEQLSERAGERGTDLRPRRPAPSDLHRQGQPGAVQRWRQEHSDRRPGRHLDRLRGRQRQHHEGRERDSAQQSAVQRDRGAG